MSKGPPPEYSPAGIAPPPSGMPAAQSIVITNPAPTLAFGPNPQNVACPSCHHQVTTSVKNEASTKTHIIAVLLCGMCCCCIPYMCSSCKNRNHYCPSCGAYLGAYKN